MAGTALFDLDRTITRAPTWTWCLIHVNGRRPRFAGQFALIALRMIGVGETSGSLIDMLGDVAEYYESEIERRLDRLTTIIEPLMMMIMGLLVGGIVVAMYIPIFQMGSTVR